MNTCKTCAHWTQHKGSIEHYGQCSSPKFVYTEKTKSGKDELHYWDGNAASYNAYFNTGADFGCIHHKETP